MGRVGPRIAALSLMLACAWLAAAWLWPRWQLAQHDEELARRLPDLRADAAVLAASCGKPPASGVLRLLVLGQSNAANHGEFVTPAAGPVRVMTAQGCAMASDPLPGGTGQGSSIWARLPAALQHAGVAAVPEFAIVAVDASLVADWSRPDSPLTAHLQARLAQLAARDWRPQLVLWQQGEADARAATSTSGYVQDFEALKRRLRAHGIDAPIVIARSTHCGAADGIRVRQAVADLLLRHDDLRPGPDTDALVGAQRHGPCHLSQAGLHTAAALWATAIGTATAPKESPGGHGP